MILFSIKNSSIKGPLNVVAPNPTRMKDFGKAIGDVLNKPHWLPAPSGALKLLLGEMSILVLEGQQVFPEKAEKNGYTFIHSFVDEALGDVLKS
jgi:NAD dependent epimerase/dehydratase family enzyme